MVPSMRVRALEIADKASEVQEERTRLAGKQVLLGTTGFLRGRERTFSWLLRVAVKPCAGDGPQGRVFIYSLSMNSTRS